jgi:hypothetical protein
VSPTSTPKSAGPSTTVKPDLGQLVRTWFPVDAIEGMAGVVGTGCCLTPSHPGARLPGNVTSCILTCMDQPGMPYEAKYGWNRQSWRIFGIALVFCAAALLPDMPLWLKIVDIVFFGGGALMTAVVSLRGTTAIRVDEAGVTLCASPLHPKSTTRLFPWGDVARVVIWQGPFSGWMNRLEYVGIDQRPGAPPITGKFTGRRSRSAARRDSPGIPPEVAVTRTATNGWVLDHGRLTAAVTHFAPGVRVVDETADPRLGGHRDQK